MIEPHRRRVRGATLRCAIGLGMLLAAVPALAADVECRVGQQVQGEMGGGKPAQLAEIGREDPHVGWYRLVWGWNAPNGDWYDPRTWAVHPADGSGDRCVVGAGATRGAAAASAVSSHRSASASTSASASAAASTSPAATSAPPSTANCPRGRRVVDRDGRRGTVEGERRGMCVVSLASGGSESYLRWMLADADGAAAPAGLPAGTYTCSTNGAGFFRITLDGEGGYTDRAGTAGEYERDGDGALSFDGGSLEDTYAQVLGPGKFGLASAPTTQYHTVCNLKR
jgi:hypothetical protein